MANKSVTLPEGVYLRGNVYWVRWYDSHGNKIRESTGRDNSCKDNLDFAKAWVESRRDGVRRGKLPEMMAEIEQKKKVKKEVYLFEHLAETYSNDEDVTKRAYWAVKKYYVAELKEFIDHIPIMNLRPADIFRQIQSVRKKGKGGERNGALRTEGSVAKVYLCFSHMLSKGVEYGICPQSIYEAACALGVQNPTDHRTNWLKLAECRALISNCGPLLRPIVVTAIMTGLRKGDILRLKWNDVDFRNDFLYVRTSKTDTPVKLKMSKKYRDMLNDLPRYGEYVFMIGEGIMFARDFRKSYATARRAAGIPDDIQFKDLRHTFASNLINNGISISAISKFLGHGSLKMTERYAHLDDEHSKQSALILENAFPDLENEADITE